MGFFIQTWTISLVVWLVFILTVYLVIMDNKKRMELKKVPLWVYWGFAMLLIFMFFSGLKVQESLCEMKKDTYNAEESKFSVQLNSCLLKDPISKRFVKEENYGHG